MAIIKNKTTEKIHTLMNAPTLYSIEDSVSDKMICNYKDLDSKMVAIENGFVGSISDCFILYAIGILRYASKESILLFLNNLSKKEPGYYIPELDNEGLTNRIKVLSKYGFIVRVDSEVTVENLSNSHLILYVVTEDGRTLANNRLQKRMKPDRFGTTRPLAEKVGMGAAACLAVRLMDSPYFIDYSDGIFKGNYCGTVKLDIELCFKKDDMPIRVAILSFFAHQNKGYMNEKALKDYKYHKLNIMRDFIVAKTREGERKGYVICVCENQKEFDEAVEFLINSNGFDDEQLPLIYFTTHSVITGVKDMKNAFLQISQDNNGEIVYSNGCDFL